MVSRADARPPPAIGADAVLGVVGVVGVRWPVDVAHVLVGAGTLVGVAHQHRDRRADGETVEDARQDLDLIGFVALGDEPALAGPAAVEVGLDVGLGSGRRGGQPSTTTPTPPPWDSPNVVTRKTVPELDDMAPVLPSDVGSLVLVRRGRARARDPSPAWIGGAWVDREG